MKKIPIISAILFILLTLAPMAMGAISSCGTEDHICDIDSSSDEEESSHDCMSFCFCSCCNHTLYVENKIEISSHSNSNDLDIHSSFIYQPPFSLTVLVDIWHPPKI